MQPASQSGGPANAAPVRILLVDDEQQLRKAIRLALTRQPKFPVAITEAASGEEGLAALAEERFDVVISDFRMPGINGVDFLEKVKATQGHAGRVLVSGHASLDVAMDAVNRGAVHGILRKPFEIAELVTVIHRALAASARPAPVKPFLNGEAAGDGGTVEDPQRVRKEISDLTKTLQQVGVRYATGALSADGFERLSGDLRRRKAALEAALLKLERGDLNL